MQYSGQSTNYQGPATACQDCRKHLNAKVITAPRACIRRVAEEHVKTFPESLEDGGIDGQMMGTGYDSLFRQLENRIENLNRENDCQLLKHRNLTQRGNILNPLMAA